MVDPQQTPSLMQQLGTSVQKTASRKAFLEFQSEDVQRLVDLHDLAKNYADEVIEEFYAHLLAHEDSQKFFSDPTTLARVKAAQKQYFLALTQGDYESAYIEDRLRIGITHERINLPMEVYLGAYSFYLRAVLLRLTEAFKTSPAQVTTTFISLLKLVFLDISLAIDTYLTQREQMIRAQQQAIQEISTPVLPLRDRLLLVPIIGAIDPPRAFQLTTQLLHSIRSYRAKAVVMDITGVPTVDSAIANHLIQTVQAARLMGATVIVSGLSPEVAHALVRIGVDLSMVRTVGSLQDGIEEAEQLVGYVVTPRRAETGVETPAE